MFRVIPRVRDHLSFLFRLLMFNVDFTRLVDLLDAGFATWRERYIGDMTRARSEAESYTPPLELRCCVDLPVASQLLPKYILDQIRQ